MLRQSAQVPGLGEDDDLLDSPSHPFKPLIQKPADDVRESKRSIHPYPPRQPLTHSSSVFFPADEKQERKEKERKEYKSASVKYKSAPITLEKSENAKKIESKLIEALGAGLFVYDAKKVETLKAIPELKRPVDVQIELDRQYAIQLQLEEYKNYLSSRKPR